VARVFDVGKLDTGEPYIAMEYLDGSDIADLLAARGRLSVEESLDYLLQACEAIAEAHVAGIIHRDLKPGNLFLAHRIDGRRLVKVLDFGISKMTGAAFQASATATHTSALMGSPLYMSPEQMGSSKAVDARSDVWALGVVLYEMLSGMRSARPSNARKRRASRRRPSPLAAKACVSRGKSNALAIAFSLAVKRASGRRERHALARSPFATRMPAMRGRRAAVGWPPTVARRTRIVA
jgi:serine/threonine protein kinase